ncbi:MAG: thiopeptide-type bacteriocin biosynthesis protein [Actinomycetota bacterium]|jgi:protein-L-isoaspartate(D-aspartate) O-methyltransferase|nr:thiopeptide-type bacteriocin biosynthesis protein [Actinomycetota bacterium]
MIADPDDLGAALAEQDAAHAGWTQVNLQSSALDLRHLRRVADDIVERNDIEEWHYVLKEPGVRIRFLGDLDSQGLAALTELGHTQLAVYEPEAHRFGGPDGLALAHHLFTADSGWALEVLGGEQLGFDRVEWSMIAINDLAVQVVGDKAELWDLWKRLEVVVQGGSAAADTATPARFPAERVRDVLTFAPAFIDAVTEPGHRLIGAARETNRYIATTLTEAGTLSVGARAWLAATTVFHWNRLALTLDELQPLVGSVLDVLDGP